MMMTLLMMKYVRWYSRKLGIKQLKMILTFYLVGAKLSTCILCTPNQSRYFNFGSSTWTTLIRS